MKFCIFHDYYIVDIYSESWSRFMGYHTWGGTPVYKHYDKYFIKSECEKCGKQKFDCGYLDEFNDQAKAKIKFFINNKKGI